MKSIFFGLLIISFLTSCKQTESQKETQNIESLIISDKEVHPSLTEAEVIAIKNGITHWDNVQEIAFTFNVDRNGKTVAQRSWLWKPETEEVLMIANGDSISYNRTKIDSTAMRADRGFINDKFWLLAPYQLVWDAGATITTQDNTVAPISQKPSKKLTIVYGNEGGYTPGDAYDFYYGDDFIINEWVFRKANSDTPSMTTTFEGYQNYKGLNIATSHKGLENDFHLYFTDIKVTH